MFNRALAVAILLASMSWMLTHPVPLMEIAAIVFFYSSSNWLLERVFGAVPW